VAAALLFRRLLLLLLLLQHGISAAPAWCYCCYFNVLTPHGVLVLGCC